MNTYRCRVSDAAGRVIRLVRESSTEESLLAELTSEGRFPLSIEAVPDEPLSGRRRFPRKTVIELTDTLSIMIDSGLSVKDSLALCRTVFPAGEPGRLVSLLASRISKGGTFHSVIDELPGSFPPVYRGLVRIGERLGSLEQVLKQLSRYLNEDKKLKDKLFGSLLYPLLVLAVAILGVVAILVVVFPRLRAVLGAFGQASAGRIDVLFGSISTSFIVAGAVLLLLGTLVFAALAVRGQGGGPGRAVDSVLLRLPLVGPAIRDVNLFLFFFAMQILASSGVSVEESLAEGAGVLSNHALRAGALEMKTRIETGEHLSAAFLAQPLFPERIGRWVAIGESVGSIERVFSELKSYYQAEMEKWTTRFMNLIEPALIILVGALVLYLVATFIIPIFSLFGSLL